MICEPFFSIILPTFNRAHLLPVAIKSVIQQVYVNWELIIVDDGSTDHTKDVVKQYTDNRIRYIYQENAERSAARNNGIKHANGDYVCFLDSDDYYLPNFLQHFYLAIITERKSIFISNYKVQKENNEIVDIDIFEKDTNDIVASIFEKKLTILSQTICCNKDFFNQHLFNENYILWEDTHLWIRAFSILPYAIVSANDVVIVNHSQSTVTRGMNRIKKQQVNQYIEAVNNLFSDYSTILPDTITRHHRINYIDAKYKMYIYQARCNKQWTLLLYLIVKAIKNKRDSENILHFLKFIFWWIISKI